MIQLKTLKLENIVTYNEATLALDCPGITLIFGNNKDAGKDSLKSNGSGKSLLLGVLAETLFDQHPLVTGKTNLKDALYRDGATVTIEFDNYRLVKKLVGKNIKYELHQLTNDGDWQDCQIRTVDYLRERLAELVPLTQEQFFTLHYIDSSRPSVLQRGTHTERLNLLAAVCGLNNTAHLLDGVKKRLKVLKESGIKLSEVLGHIDLTQRDLLEDANQLKVRLVSLTSRKEELSRESADLNRKLTLRATYDAYRDDYRVLSAAFAVVTGATLESIKTEILRRKPIVAGRIERLKSYEALQDTRKRCVSAIDRLRSFLVDYESEESLQATLNVAQDIAVKRESLTRNLEYLRREKPLLSDSLQALETALQREGVLDLGDIKAREELWLTRLNESRNVYQQSRLKCETLQRLLESPHVTCPTCLQAVDREVLTTLLAEESRRSESLANKVKLAKDRAEKLGDYLTYLKAMGEYTASLSQSEALQAELATLPIVNIGELHRGLLAYKDLSQYEQELTKVDDLLAKMVPLDAEKIERQRKQVELQFNSVTRLQPVFKTFEESLKVSQEDTTTYDADVIRITSEIRLLDKEINQLSQNLAISDVATKRLASLEDRKIGLEQELTDLPVLKALEEAYGQKGLRILAMQRICEEIETNLNLYANLLFAEPVSFSIEVGESYLNILVTRKFQNQLVTVDVRRLSGAEGRAFNLLLPLAILPVLPDRCRLNMLALDEPTANMDEPATNMFVNRYLPKVSELVPSVIVLSPTPLQIEGARVLEVTRHKGESTLTEKVIT